MIKNSDSKYDDYSISLKIRHILLHWGYELTGKEFELTNKSKSLKRLLKMRNENEKWEMRNENDKWEWKMRMKIKLWNNKKKILICRINA